MRFLMSSRCGFEITGAAMWDPLTSLGLGWLSVCVQRMEAGLTQTEGSL